MTPDDRERYSTPPAQSPWQNPTPKTPERKRTQSQDSFDRSDSEAAWTSCSIHLIQGMSEEEAKRMLTSALKHISVLEDANMLLEGQKSHLRFNFNMLNSEREQMLKRCEVEQDITISNESLLLYRLRTAKDEEQMFRQRHLKAKKRVTELTEDTKRQQLSIDHLKRALSFTRPEYTTPPTRQDTGSHGEGGLEVLSDAAGLAQLREMTRSDSSLETSQKVQSGPLLSPAAFPSGDSYSEPNSKKKRKSSNGGIFNQQDSTDKAGFVADGQVQNMSRRLTFNSSAPTVTPMTPKSPRRCPKLEPSAMS